MQISQCYIYGISIMTIITSFLHSKQQMFMRMNLKQMKFDEFCVGHIKNYVNKYEEYRN